MNCYLSMMRRCATRMVIRIMRTNRGWIPDREINLVSDLRLKRYIRDYFEQYLGEPIFVCNIDGRTVTSTGRLEALSQEKKKSQTDLLNDDAFLMDNLMDVRFFGATMTIKEDKSKNQKSEIQEIHRSRSVQLGIFVE